MMSGRATRVIAERTALRTLGPLEVAAGTCAAIAAFVVSQRLAEVAGAAGIVLAALVSVGPARVAALTDLRYFAAPLYGRELARALAFAPCAAAPAYALVAGLCVVALRALEGAPIAADGWMRLAALAAAQTVAVIVALSGCLRRGTPRRLYVGLGCVAGGAVAVVGSTATPMALLLSLAGAALLGFAALRALGETLARYDPVGED